MKKKVRSKRVSIDIFHASLWVSVAALYFMPQVHLLKHSVLLSILIYGAVTMSLKDAGKYLPHMFLAAVPSAIAFKFLTKNKNIWGGLFILSFLCIASFMVKSSVILLLTSCWITCGLPRYCRDSMTMLTIHLTAALGVFAALLPLGVMPASLVSLPIGLMALIAAAETQDLTGKHFLVVSALIGLCASFIPAAFPAWLSLRPVVRPVVRAVSVPAFTAANLLLSTGSLVRYASASYEDGHTVKESLAAYVKRAYT